MNAAREQALVTQNRNLRAEVAAKASKVKEAIAEIRSSQAPETQLGADFFGGLLAWAGLLASDYAVDKLAKSPSPMAKALIPTGIGGLAAAAQAYMRQKGAAPAERQAARTGSAVLFFFGLDRLARKVYADYIKPKALPPGTPPAK